MAPYCLGGNVCRPRARGGRGKLGLFTVTSLPGYEKGSLRLGLRDVTSGGMPQPLLLACITRDFVYTTFLAIWYTGLFF